MAPEASSGISKCCILVLLNGRQQPSPERCVHEFLTQTRVEAQLILLQLMLFQFISGVSGKLIRVLLF
jgi:hypothetical protein